jgi:DNA-directed RNA polymerase subunit beta
MRPFFGTYPLPQVFYQTNPLRQTVHGRKVTCLGPGGLTGRTASFRSQDIHPSQYERIYPLTRPKESMLDLPDR